MPAGSVVSFMLPNWHEAAVIYLGATLAGMVVNPILPSLRDRELQFILSDADSRVIFIPSEFGTTTTRRCWAGSPPRWPSPPEVVVLRGDARRSHCRTRRCSTEPTAGGPAGAGPRRGADDPLHLRNHRPPEGCSAHPQFDPRADPPDRRRTGSSTDGDKFLVPSPIAHIGGSIYAFECPLLLGSTAVLMERWDAGPAVGLMMLPSAARTWQGPLRSWRAC